MFKALVYAYVLGGLTFIPLVVAAAIFIAVYTSVPVGEVDMAKKKRRKLEMDSVEEEKDKADVAAQDDQSPPLELNDLPTTRKGWLTVRRTFEESENDTSYVTLVRSFLDSRSKDPKRSKPKDMWYAVLKRNILYLYEDEDMLECEAAIELSGHDVVVYPEGLPDAELYAKRNAICLRRKAPTGINMPSVTREMKLQKDDIDAKMEMSTSSDKKKETERGALVEADEKADAAREEAFAPETPWFIFVRSNLEMEDWYFSLLHASSHPAQTPTLLPLRDVFEPKDMNHLVNTLDDQPDVIPMRWLNALLGRIFFSHYRTHHLEAYIIGRLMKKLEKVKRPQFLTDISVTEVSVGNTPPMLSKPMLKELTKEGDASLEVHFQYKGEIRITIEATAVINLGARFKSYTVKLVLAAVLKELEGNLLIKVKRPPSNRIWYAFTQTPRMVLEVEPIVSDRQITWGMILSTIESKFKEIIQESVVMPNMDDISFFDSSPYGHRGGIFAEASRHLHPTAIVTPPEMTDDVQSTASAPNPDASSPQPPLAPSSQSEVLLTVKTTSSLSSSDSKTVNEPTGLKRKTSRRKTWFSSVKSDDGLASPDIFSASGEDNASKHSRGRQGFRGNSSGIDSSSSRSPARRRTGHPVSLPTKTDQDPPSDASPSQRPQSRLSNRERDEPDSEQQEAADTATMSPKWSRTLERRKSDVSQKNRSPSPPSFFSTLKSRAGDKQALSNTAKETMRKWGVNWGGLKKETNAGASSGEDLHENASFSSRSNAGTSSSGHKPRASYAEVRAAVAERKEKERMAETEGGNTSDSGIQLPGQVSATFPADSVQSDNLHPSIVSASARLSTPHLTSKKSSPSISRVNTDIDAEPLEIAESPIHVQPQAKTMTIPGINVKNRGEIQSLGYVAPQPPPPAASTPSAIIESKLKNPAIQTVYRFWKNPSLINREQDTTQQQGALSHTAEQGGAEADRGGDIVQIASDSHPAVSSEGVERRSPPPLPPRSGHIPMGTSKPAVSNPPGFVSSSPASEALKSIVTKDDGLRSTIAHEQGEEAVEAEPTDESEVTSSPASNPECGALNSIPSGAPPPLPPRRVSAIA